MANLYRCGRSCNTFEDLSDGIHITTTINESKSLIKHISCDSKCRFDGNNAIKTKNRIKISVDAKAKNPQKQVPEKLRKIFS